MVEFLEQVGGAYLALCGVGVLCVGLLLIAGYMERYFKDED